MTVPEVLGVLGFAGAAVGLYLQWRQHEWSKRSFWLKEEPEARARVTYNPRTGPPEAWNLQAWVVNSGPKPFYIRAVLLEFQDLSGGFHGCVFYRRDDKRNPVDPGDERYYQLCAGDHGGLPHLSALSQDSMCLKVETFVETLLTVPGSEFEWIRSDYDDELAQKEREKAQG